MKKITLLKRFGVICLGFILSSAMVASATQYCHTAITSSDGTTTIYMTCQAIGVDLYEFKLETNDVFDGVQGNNLFTNVAGDPPVYNIGGNLQVQDGGKTLITTISSVGSAPSNLHGLFLEIRYAGPVFKVFNFTNDIDWSADCGTVVPDNVLPVMGAASVVGTPTFNSVNLLLSATDDVTDPVVHFFANDVTNGITNKAIIADASGNATVTGLASSTSYNLTITARDAAGNISANSVSVSFTTASRSSECFGDKGHFATPTVYNVHYTITTNANNTDLIYKIAPFEAGRTLDFAEVHTTSGYYPMTIAEDGLSATYTHAGLTSGTALGIRFMYSLDNMGGNEMTSADVNLGDPNIIYFKAGDQCTATSVNQLDTKNIRIYPTLVKDNLQISSEQEINQIEVKNILGQTVRVFDTKGFEKSVSLNGISAGNYIVTVKTATGKLSVQKIVKQ